MKKSSKSGRFSTGKMLPDAFFDPVAVGRRQLGDRPNGEGGVRIAVQLGDAFDQGVCAFNGCLDQGRALASGLDRAFPAVDGSAGLEDVDAGGEALLDHLPADAWGLGEVGEDGVERDGGHFCLPTTCAPHVTEATTSAPTAWGSTRRRSPMPPITVAWPSRIGGPKAGG